MCTGEFEIRNLSLVQKLYEARHSGENDSVLDSVLIGIAAYDEINVHTIGDERSLFDGDTGRTNFHAGNEPDFLSAANRFTDGVSNWVVLNTIFVQENKHQGGSSQGISESEYFQAETDLSGHTIDLIRRDVHKLIIQPTYYVFDVTWSFWEYTDQNNDTWVQITPYHGVIASATIQEIQVSFNSANLSPGVYTADLLVDFGKACKLPVSIPVTMTVEQR